MALARGPINSAVFFQALLSTAVGFRADATMQEIGERQKKNQEMRKNDDAAHNKNRPLPAVETETEALFHSQRRDKAQDHRMVKL